MDELARYIGIERISRRFGELAAVDDVSLDIARGEFFSLLGPSGCGKTTLLRILAGLEMPDAGRVLLDNTDMTCVPAHLRPVNLVFQHYALFPHLTVGDNVAFGLRYRKIPRDQWSRGVLRALEIVRLSGLESRRPGELSGGQRQRVALARALVLEPKVLLLDEPLGALDQKLRKEMQVELKNIQRELDITFVFVTHDQEEALTMSDRIAVMNHGRIEQVGRAEDVFERPATRFVAEFMGAGNFFSFADGGSFIVRPEKLRLDAAAPAGVDASLPVVVEQRLYQGISTLWTLRDPQGGRYTVYEQNDQAAGHTALQAGDAAVVWWLPEHVVKLDRAASGDGSA